MWSIIDQAEALRGSLTALVDQDAAAYQAYISATRLPKDTSEQRLSRENNILEATLEASLVPLQVSHIAVTLLDLAYRQRHTAIPMPSLMQRRPESWQKPA